jgi:hypothetical protein
MLRSRRPAATCTLGRKSPAVITSRCDSHRRPRTGLAPLRVHASHQVRGFRSDGATLEEEEPPESGHNPAAGFAVTPRRDAPTEAAEFVALTFTDPIA